MEFVVKYSAILHISLLFPVDDTASKNTVAVA
jgi:hypothetical protein